jgi:hypothetical protein
MVLADKNVERTTFYEYLLTEDVSLLYRLAVYSKQVSSESSTTRTSKAIFFLFGQAMTISCHVRNFSMIGIGRQGREGMLHKTGSTLCLRPHLRIIQLNKLSPSLSSLPPNKDAPSQGCLELQPPHNSFS